MNPGLRKILLVLIDIILVNVAFIAALLIRFDGAVPKQYFTGYINLAALITVIYIVSYYIFGLYKKIWQYASVGELLTIISAVSVGTVTTVAALFFLEKFRLRTY